MPGLLPAVSLLRERQGVGAGQGWFTKWDEGPQGLAPLPLPPHGGHRISPLCSGQATVHSLLQEVPPPNTHHLDPSTSPFSASLKPQRAEAIPTQPSPLCLLVPMRGHPSLLQDTPLPPSLPLLQLCRHQDVSTNRKRPSLTTHKMLTFILTEAFQNHPC